MRSPRSSSTKSLEAEGQTRSCLLAVLYNTGARIQEALDLSPQSVSMGSAVPGPIGSAKVAKSGIASLWPETVALLRLSETHSARRRRADLCESLR